MASVVFVFQVHQPYRLRRYSVFDSDPFYFDDSANGQICQRVAEKCYRPMTRLLLEQVRAHGGRFRVAFSITGTAMEQLAEYAPDVLVLLRELAQTGCCEFLGETSHHSLSFVYSPAEFARQVNLHARLIEEHFGQRPTVFRNTELIYGNDVARAIGGVKGGLGTPTYAGVLCEGVDHLLGPRSPGFVYRPPGGARAGGGAGGLGLLLRNSRLSDDIGFRFGNRGWAQWPLTAEKYAYSIAQISPEGQLCNIFLDYETFGEHQWADTGIFRFMAGLPGTLLEARFGNNDFLTPSEALRRYQPSGEYDVPGLTSWADTERDLSPWAGNAMQANALGEIYRLEPLVMSRLDSAGSGQERALAEGMVRDWRRLTTSDHFYYMSTKGFADGDVHKYFSPYDSPYDAYINFMNVLDNLRVRVGR